MPGIWPAEGIIAMGTAGLARGGKKPWTSCSFSSSVICLTRASARAWEDGEVAAEAEAPALWTGGLWAGALWAGAF